MPTGVTMLEAFGTNVPGLTVLLTALAYGVGMWAGASALLLLWRRQRFEANATLGGIAARVVLCATLLYLPTAIATGQETLFGAPTPLSYTAGSAVSANGQVVIATVLKFVQLVGLWALIWGFILLNRAHARGYEPGLGGKALAHIVGGVLCLNVVASLQGLAQTFGLEKVLAYLIVPG